MKKSLYIIAAILFILPAISSAQMLLDLKDFYSDIGPLNILYTNNSKKEQEVAGSPYAQEHFMNGSVIQNDSIIYKQIPLKYNIYNDQILFKHNDGMEFYLAAPEKFKEIRIAGQRYIYRDFLKGNKKTNGYYELLEEGKISLLKKELIVLKEAQQAKAYKDPEPARFIMKPTEYYLLKDGNKIFAVKNEKHLLTLLDHKEELKAFIKKNKLKTRKAEDLIRIISHYNKIS